MLSTISLRSMEVIQQIKNEKARLERLYTCFKVSYSRECKTAPKEDVQRAKKILDEMFNLLRSIDNL